MLNLNAKLKYLKDNKRVIPRVIKNYLLILIKRKKRLRTVELVITYDCQCDCEHCSCANLRNKKRRILTIEQIKKIIDESIKEGTIHFILTGGEPLLFNGLYAVIDYIKFKGGIVSLATNGLELNDINIKRLKSSKIDLVEVSIDFPDMAAHNKFRNIKDGGTCLWEKMNKARKVGLNIGISILCQKKILKKELIIRLIKKAKQNKLLLSICYPSAIGRWYGVNSKLLSKKEFDYINWIKRHFKISSCEDNCYLKKGCSAGVEKIAITPYGDVMPCPLISLKFGNIKKEDLPSILKKMRKTKYFNEIQPRCLPASNREFLKLLK
ncbi:MAG: radical SAM protein [Nanoarchaeota archaeon]